MSSRKEQKARARQERLAKEQQRRRDERRRRLRVATAAAVGVALITLGAGIVRPWERGPTEPFAYASDGVAQRVARAGLRPGSGPHVHPKLNVVIRGQPIAVPANMGLGAPPQPMHTHDTDGTIHVEGAAAGTTLGEFMALWGVALSTDRLGPYRTNRTERLRMWVKAPQAKAFTETRPRGSLPLTDGEELYLSYGSPSQAPIA